VETAVVGVRHVQYVVDDAGFQRHIEADQVDRQVLSVFLQQLEANKEMAVEQALLNMMGKDDLFTKAAIDAQLQQRRHGPDHCPGHSPAQARDMLGMLGFAHHHQRSRRCQ
jgi:hypothetical protein